MWSKYAKKFVKGPQEHEKEKKGKIEKKIPLFSVQMLCCFQKKNWYFFLTPKKWKNRPQKLLIIGLDPFIPQSSPDHRPEPRIDFSYYEISGPDICSLICVSCELKSRGSYGNSALFLQRSQYISLGRLKIGTAALNSEWLLSAWLRYVSNLTHELSPVLKRLQPTFF